MAPYNREDKIMSTAVGLDLGKSSIKHVTAISQGEIPALLSTGRIVNVMGTQNGNGAIRYKGNDFIVGREAVLGTGFSWSAAEQKDGVRNLIFALAVLGSQGITDADMVVGLPVSQANSTAMVNRFKALLGGRHEVVVSDRMMMIEINVSVVAEPLGTYFSLVIAPDGRMIGSSPYLAELVGIVDVGYRTVDVVALDGGSLATTRDSTLSGIAVLFSAIVNLLEQDYGKLRPNEITKVHTWLIGSCQEPLTIAGKSVRADLASEVAHLKTDLAGRILDEVGSVLSAIRPNKLIVTGGGAALLRSELLRIKPELTFHPQPRMANAIGFYRACVSKRNGNHGS
jgi:hypothetical protein